MISNQFLLKVLLVPALFWASVVCGAATPSGSGANSADQALDQLRILQKRLGGSSNFNGATPAMDNGSKSSTSALETTIPPTKKIPKKIDRPSSASTSLQPKSGADAVLSQESSSEELISRAAFEGVEQQLFPLSPEQITQLKRDHKTQQFAKESPVGTPPKPTATSQFVN